MSWNNHIPCWQIAPCTIVTESKTFNVSFSSFLNARVVRDKNAMRIVNPINVKSVTIHTSNLNGRMQMLWTLDSGGCLNNAAGLQSKLNSYVKSRYIKMITSKVFQQCIVSAYCL